MTCIIKTICLVCFILCVAQVKGDDYQVPTPKVEALYPKGFRVTLKDDGYTFFGFRGNINKEFKKLGPGDIKQDIVKPKGGYWVYKNRDAELKVGDTIFYWIYVLKNGKGYMNLDLEYTVTGFVREDGMPVSGQTTQAPSGEQPPKWTPTPEPELDHRFDPTTPPCMISKTMVQGRSNICKDTLIFNEEFNKENLGQLKEWDALVQFPRDPDYPFNVYIPDNTVTFEDSSLVITPVLTDADRQPGFLYQALNLDVRCTGKTDTAECKYEPTGAQILPPVTTAKISTRRTFNFKFGRIEVRAKLPSGSWLTPEINLESSDKVYGPNNYESGLMRVAFVRGNPGLAKKLYGGPVLTNREPFRSMLLQEKIGIDNWHKDFHNYSMIWRPDGIDLLVDGEQYGTINPGGGFFEIAKKSNVAHASHWQKGTVMAPLDQMFHITLGIRVGGVNDFGDGLEDKPWKDTGSKAMLDFWKAKDSWYPSWYNSALKVDFIRVYAL